MVYPRACGGTQLAQRMQHRVEGLSPRLRGGDHLRYLVDGLSPRLRGNRFVVLGTCYSFGSIPAPAGEPVWSPRSWPSAWVYPRACGGTCRHFNTMPVYPRACGGTLHGQPSTRIRLGLSPRLRGNHPGDIDESVVRGLSPRLRGNLGHPLLVPIVAGSIPAPAGEPVHAHGHGHEELMRSIPAPAGEPIGPESMIARVYPRASPDKLRVAGLSPRLRGKPLVRKATWPVYPRDRKTVYPRACGGTPTYTDGLSPRLRGKTKATEMNWRGSIPAPAGEPGVPPPFAKRSGLSPRLRGNLPTPHTRGQVTSSTGSIPAPAGEPSRRRSPNWIRSIPAPAGEPSGTLRTEGGVYPRACGGTGYTYLQQQWGLSPRLRGNPTLAVVAFLYTVYPRACGGTLAIGCPASKPLPGLSPRLRGNPEKRAGRRSSASGLSPRLRGNQPHRGRRRQGVYPRACGGTKWERAGQQGTGLSPRLRGNRNTIELGDNVTAGLSPRLRGNQGRMSGAVLGGSIPAPAGEPEQSSGTHLLRRRSIPAPAGEPRSQGPGTGIRGLSPRLRGNRTRGRTESEADAAGLSPRLRGNPARQSINPRCWGLSPRLRGNLPEGGGPASDSDRLGLSPRLRGNPWRGIPVPFGLSPRLRGNPRISPPAAIVRDGLSPRLRGNPPGVPAGRDAGVYPRACGGMSMARSGCGSIPAPAGEPKRYRQVARPRVYPRACGGTPCGVIFSIGLVDVRATS